jgi:hypothetical protein
MSFCISGRRKVVKTPWSCEEKKVVHSGLAKCFEQHVLPKKLECTELINKNPVLKRRSWTMVKGYVRTRLLAIANEKKRNLDV